MGSQTIVCGFSPAAGTENKLPQQCGKGTPLPLMAAPGASNNPKEPDARCRAAIERGRRQSSPAVAARPSSASFGLLNYVCCSKKSCYRRSRCSRSRIWQAPGVLSFSARPHLRLANLAAWDMFSLGIFAPPSVIRSYAMIVYCSCRHILATGQRHDPVAPDTLSGVRHWHEFGICLDGNSPVPRASCNHQKTRFRSRVLLVTTPS